MVPRLALSLSDPCADVAVGLDEDVKGLALALASMYSHIWHSCGLADF